MKIVVTGGSGNIGRAVVRHFAEGGHSVLNLDRRRPRDAGAPGEFAYCDLSRRDVLELHLARFAPEAVCHLAEIPDAIRVPEADAYAGNAAGTGTLFQTAAEMGVKRVAYASTVQVYAQFGRLDGSPPPAPAALPMTEAEPPRPNNGYGAQKVGAEAYLAALAGRFEMTAAALRIPGCRDFLGSDWLAYAFRDGGRRSRGGSDGVLHELGAWLDSRDCATAFAACVAWEEGEEGEPPWQRFEAFNVAADTPWRTPDSPPTRDRLAATFPGGPPLPADFPEHGAPYDSSKLRRLTAWRPAVSIDDLWRKAGITENP